MFSRLRWCHFSCSWRDIKFLYFKTVPSAIWPLFGVPRRHYSSSSFFLRDTSYCFSSEMYVWWLRYLLIANTIAETMALMVAGWGSSVLLRQLRTGTLQRVTTQSWTNSWIYWNGFSISQGIAHTENFSANSLTIVWKLNEIVSHSNGMPVPYLQYMKLSWSISPKIIPNIAREVHVSMPLLYWCIWSFPEFGHEPRSGISTAETLQCMRSYNVYQATECCCYRKQSQAVENDNPFCKEMRPGS